jgi:CRISPR-associated protein Cas1
LASLRKTKHLNFSVIKNPDEVYLFSSLHQMNISHKESDAYMSIWIPLKKLINLETDNLNFTGDTPDEFECEEAPYERSPLATPIHILATTAKVRLDNGRLRIEQENGDVHERPIELISALHIHGWATITSPAIRELISYGTPIMWRSPTGYPVGYTASLNGPGVEIRRNQFAAIENGNALKISKALIKAKIINMRGLIRRKQLKNAQSYLKPLQTYARKIERQTCLNKLRGFEGAASAKYFSSWPKLLHNLPLSMEFKGRSKRPPQDQVNASLSYLYALLAGECLTAITTSGLDPRLGFLHATRAGRPALALDLMEPFRSLIADRVVLSAFNRNQLREDHFRKEKDAILLSDEGKHLFISLFEKRLAKSISPKDHPTPLTYRQSISNHAEQIAKACTNPSSFNVLEVA